MASEGFLGCSDRASGANSKTQIIQFTISVSSVATIAGFQQRDGGDWKVVGEKERHAEIVGWMPLRILLGKGGRNQQIKRWRSLSPRTTNVRNRRRGGESQDGELRGDRRR